MADQYRLNDSPDDIRLAAAWKQALGRLANEVPEQWMKKFIEPVRPVRFADSTVTLSVPGNFVLEWLRARYVPTISSILSDELGEDVTIDLVAEPNPKGSATLKPLARQEDAVSTETSGFRPDPNFRFDTFVVGQSNRLAVAGANAVASQPGTKYNPLFIYGPAGVGKTHLLHSIAHCILAKNPRFPIAYMPAQHFVEEFVHALTNNRIEAFRRMQRNVGVWLVDDIQFIAGKDRTQEEIFHTFNYLQSLGKQIVLCSDRPPRELSLMEDRLVSRFESGLVADIMPPDTETRAAILMKQAEREAVELPTEIAMYLAEHVSDASVRTLQGALTRLLATCSLDARPLTVDAAEELVRKHYHQNQSSKPGVLHIIDFVGKRLQIEAVEIRSATRKAPIAHARHVAVYLAREITGGSWKHLGSMFGNRDHTSMIHSYQRVCEMMKHDREFRSQVKQMMRDLYPEA